MKNIILYLFSIVAAIIVIYCIKNSNIQNQTDSITELRHSDYIRAEMEVLNGCGESGVANLFTKFLATKFK